MIITKWRRSDDGWQPAIIESHIMIQPGDGVDLDLIGLKSREPSHGELEKEKDKVSQPEGQRNLD